MLIKGKKLLNLPVYTKSGQLLGMVDDLEVDADDQMIVRYQVKSKNVIKSLFEDKLLIHRSQIISITADKIIVDDNVLKQKEELVKGEEEIKKIAEKKAVSPTVNSTDK